MTIAELLHDLTDVEFFFAFIARSRAMWLSSFAMYGDPDAPRYAAVWVPRALVIPGQSSQTLALGLGPAAAMNPAAATPGFVPRLIAATGTKTRLRFSFVLQKGNAATFGNPMVQLNLDPNALNPHQAGNGAVPKVPSSVAIYNTDSWTQVKAAAILTNWVDSNGHMVGYRPWATTLTRYGGAAPGGDPFVVWEGALDHDVMRSGFVRPEVSTPIYGDLTDETPPQFFTLWRGDCYEQWPADLTDSFDMGVRCLGPLQSNEIDDYVELMKTVGPGYTPLAIGASTVNTYGNFEQPLFAITFRPIAQSVPLPRRLVILSGGTKYPSSQKVSSSDPIVEPTTPRFVSPTLPPITTLSGVWSPTDPNFAALDTSIVNHLSGDGIHGAQWAAAKNDNLVAARAYTWAEEGYPVLTPRTPMAIDSISKSLVGMAIVHFFAPNGDTSLLKKSIFSPELLDIQVHPANLANATATTLDRCLYFQTGFSDLLDHIQYYPLIAALADPPSMPPPLPGSQSTFFGAYPQSLYTHSPPATYAYEGGAARLMSELLSLKVSPVALPPARAHFETAMAFWWWGNQTDPRTFILPATRNECLQRGLPPMHGSAPIVKVGFGDGEGPHVPFAYWRFGAYSQGSGGWAMSATTLVRLYNALAPSRTTGPSLTTAELAVLVAPDSTGRGRHVGLSTRTEDVTNIQLTQVMYGGGWLGSSSFAQFEFRSDFALHDTWAFATMTNQDAFGSLDLATFYANIRALDLANLPPVDYDGV